VTTPIKLSQGSPRFIDFSPVLDTQQNSAVMDIRKEHLLNCLNRSYSVEFLYGINAAPESYAIQFFFKNHVTRTRHIDSQRGYLELLPQLYEKSNPNSLLRKVSYAVGLGILCNAKKSPELRVQARQIYGKSLKELSMAIRDPALAVHDETVITILLLSLCEVSLTISVIIMRVY
jgi:hypothetical protein